MNPSDRHALPCSGDFACQTLADLIGRGEYLIAFDATQRQLPGSPDDPRLRYYSALSLARAGATERAHEELRWFVRAGERLEAAAPDLAYDIAELQAEVATRRTLDASGIWRQASAREAAAFYEALNERFGRPRDCVNAAAMWLVAGERGRSQQLARATLALCERSTSSEETYWRLAAVAGARLLLGDPVGARDTLKEAVCKEPVDVSTSVASRRMSLLICDLLSVDRGVLAPIASGMVLHYCGHRIGCRGRGRFPAETESSVATAVARYVEQANIGSAFGSLASGADILCAEALLRRNVALHLVLPFASDDFVRESVRPGGLSWVERFSTCLMQATSVTFATTGSYGGDDNLYAFASALAMGRALVQARSLGAEIAQLAVWDGQPTEEPAGTARDVRVWAQMGLRQTIIPTVPTSRSAHSHSPVPHGMPTGQAVKAIVVARACGSERLGNLEGTLNRCGNDIHCLDISGEHMTVVAGSVTTATRCALALQQSRAHGLRVAAHVRPASDPGELCGITVPRLRVPAGEVYVTEPFAALLALEADASVRCEPVGHMPHGALEESPMYVLKAGTESATEPPSRGVRSVFYC